MVFFCSDPDGAGCQMVTLSASRREAYGRGWRFGSEDARHIGTGEPVCRDCRFRGVREAVAAAREAFNAAH